MKTWRRLGKRVSELAHVYQLAIIINTPTRCASFAASEIHMVVWQLISYPHAAYVFDIFRLHTPLFSLYFSSRLSNVKRSFVGACKGFGFSREVLIWFDPFSIHDHLTRGPGNEFENKSNYHACVSEYTSHM